MGFEIQIKHEVWPIKGGFAIARGSKQNADVIVVTVSDGDHVGRGECVPYARYGETIESVIAQIEAVENKISEHDDLAMLLPAGAARNALDCALWDVHSKRKECTVFELLGRKPVQTTATAYTVSLDSPAVMQSKAQTVANMPLLKIKLTGQDDLARVEAVQRGAPDAQIMVDANESWSEATYSALVGPLAQLGVIAIEQPFAVGQDDALQHLPRPIPVVADESCHTSADLPSLVGKYDFVNIKLDKTGGLSEAIVMEGVARQMGFKIMVGCMVATSLSMAPALLLAGDAELVDLDGPLLLDKDRAHGLVITNGIIAAASPALWG